MNNLLLAQAPGCNWLQSHTYPRLRETRPGATDGKAAGITQPRAHSLADTCTEFQSRLHYMELLASEGGDICIDAHTIFSLLASPTKRENHSQKWQRVKSAAQSKQAVCTSCSDAILFSSVRPHARRRALGLPMIVRT